MSNHSYRVFKNLTIDPHKVYYPKRDGYVHGAIMTQRKDNSGAFRSPLGNNPVYVHELVRENAIAKGYDIQVGDVVGIKTTRENDEKFFKFSRTTPWVAVAFNPSVQIAHPDHWFSADDWEKWRAQVHTDQRIVRSMLAIERAVAVARGVPSKRLKITIDIDVDANRIPEFTGVLNEVLDWWAPDYDLVAEYVDKP